jgi:hypothetical protein
MKNTQFRQMNSYITVVLFFSFLLSAGAQSDVSLDSILSKPHQEISRFDTSGFGFNQLAIRFPYGSACVLNKYEYKTVQAFRKISVTYIYSQYTRSQPGQKELDRARFEALVKLDPELLGNPEIKWNILVQTDAVTPAEARKMFHGFVISYESPVDEEKKSAIRADLEELIECARRKPPVNAPVYPDGTDELLRWLAASIRFPADRIKGKNDGIYTYAVFNIDSITGKPHHIEMSYGASEAHNNHIKTVLGKMKPWIPGRRDVEFAVRIHFYIDDTGVKVVEPEWVRAYVAKDCKGVNTDSTVSAVLERNRQWKKMLVVEDVTGSMLPYIANLLLWNALKVNMDNTLHFVFFNDGADKDDSEKEVGSTGGLYHVKPTTEKVLEETMVEAIGGGTGGDRPENDIEAVMEGLKACPDCEDIVLISDNYATPRDLELLPQIKKPIHVIVCGARKTINPAHIFIAWKTGGTLHTIDQDITRLAKMKEGDVLDVYDRSYKIVNGKFILLSKM